MIQPRSFPINALPADMRPMVAEALAQAHDERLVGAAIAPALSLSGEGLIAIEGIDVEELDADDRASLDLFMTCMDEHDRMIITALRAKFAGLLTEATGGVRRTVTLSPEVAQMMYGPPMKAPRNAPCPCGSGRKYKRCCGR